MNRSRIGAAILGLAGIAYDVNAVYVPPVPPVVYQPRQHHNPQEPQRQNDFNPNVGMLFLPPEDLRDPLWKARSAYLRQERAYAAQKAEAVKK